jgi:phosphoglucomutase
VSSVIERRFTSKELQNNTKTSPLPGRPAPKEWLPDVTRLEREYFERQPNVADPSQLVSFGMRGHRGSPLNGTFTEVHIIALAQAICNYRRRQTLGPLLPSYRRSYRLRDSTRNSSRLQLLAL